jgi:hypothetical protein
MTSTTPSASVPIPLENPVSGPLEFDPRRPFRRSEGLAAGLTDSDLVGPGYERLFHGLYVAAPRLVDTWQRARAALHTCPPDSYISHDTAAELWGGVRAGGLDIHVCVPSGGYRPQRRGIVAHQSCDGDAPVHHRRLPLASPSKTFLQVAASRRDLVELVVLGDSLVKAKRVEPDQLITATSTHHGRGAKLARIAASRIRAGVDSATESRLRMLIVLARLPEPVVNFCIRDEIGTILFQFDLCYPALRLIIAYDGRHHRDVRAQWLRDLRRRE